MDHNSANLILEDIESKLDITSFKFKNKCIWPILKYHLLFGMLKFKEERGNTNNVKTNVVNIRILKKVKAHFLQIKALLLNYFKFKVSFLRYKIQVKHYDILCIDVADNLYEETVNEKKYSRYFTPYVEFLKSNGDMLLLNTNKSNFNHDNKYITPYIFNTEAYTIYKRILISYKKKFTAYKQEIKNFSIYKNYIKNEIYANVVTEAFLIRELEEVDIYESVWLKLLKVVKPKTIFLSCYYGNNSNYGLISAANILSIKTIEIQHGVASGDMYLGYNKLTKKTKNYLPDFYWCWSIYDEFNILTTRKNSKIFTPIVGGNLWFAKSINENIKNNSDDELKKIIKLKSPQKIIFVTLQHSISLSNILIDAIRLSQPDWLWLIRFHPRDYVDSNYRTNYINAFSKFSNVEYEYSSKANIYSILKQVNVHVTHFSTTAIEAISFEIPTILLDDTFQNIYKEYIDSGIFYIAKDGDQIIKYVSNNLSINTEKSNYFKMQYDADIALSALKKILNSN